ncbi:MAG: AE-binding protein [Blautia sp.]|nr:AE-binding protein [Blautia sp.]MDY3999676.1 AE-binding protein [Blautia sp.]
MPDKNKPSESSYDDGNIPEIDLPKDSWITEPLPESSRPRKDGPGGDDNDRQ